MIAFYILNYMRFKKSYSILRVVLLHLVLCVVLVIVVLYELIRKELLLLT